MVTKWLKAFALSLMLHLVYFAFLAILAILAQTIFC